MKLRNPWLIRLVASLAVIALRIWLGTVRYHLSPSSRRLDPNDPELAGRYIYSFWHESLLCAAGLKTKLPIFALVSRHADGELIAQVVEHLGFRTVRGSSTRGGMEAVRQLLLKGRKAHLMVTPDGPRGPRRQLQEGVVFIASRTGLPIVPVGVGFTNAWRASSWDHFAVPKPWSTIGCFAGQVIHVSPDLDREELEAYRVRVEQEMLAVTVKAEEWASKR